MIYPKIKRLMDLLMCLLLIPLLILPMGVLAIVVKLDSKGPVLFRQKRVGKDNTHFTILKFRTMYIDTDPNTPTHLLGSPEDKLTKVGKVLRKLSLDELPQLFNILAGNMSFIGPRPALWNQYDLIALRDENGASTCVPGLSGWAQVKGRDTLALEEKARLDGEYAQKQSFLFDAKCFFLTLVSVISAKGNKEGGTGKQENKKIKILMATTIAKAFGWFVSDSAENFSQKGFDVTVMCGEMDEDFINRHEKFAHVVPLSVTRGMNPVSTLKCVIELSKLFRKEHFDIIQYSTPNIAFCCSLARGFKKIPVRVYGQWGLRYEGFRGIKRFVLKALEKFTCKRATHIYATSKKNRQISIDEKLTSEDKIFVIGHGGTVGVDFSSFDLSKKEQYRKDIRKRYNIPEDAFLFGYTGRINRDKGISELLSAFRAILAEKPETRLMLVGMEDSVGMPDRDILEWAKSSDNIIFTGGVDSSLVPEYMSAMDILVHPTYREGFSMVLQEAMAMGVPIITTDIPGPSEVITEGKTGVLVPAKDVEALYKEMKSLMGDPHRMDRFSRDGRRRVELFFARPIMLRNIYNKYCELLGIDDRRIRLMYLTSKPEFAIMAQEAGVDRIFLDLEILGKFERQGHLDTVVSHSSFDDVSKLRRVLKDAELVVRCNPVHEGLSREIDSIIDDGADMIILPYFKTVDEVKKFLSIVGGRVRTMLLFETKESVESIDEILALEGIDEAFVGLNDLHLSYKTDFMFRLLSDGTVERICEKFREKKIPYGFGGLAKIGEGLVPAQYIIPEHKRIGSTSVILSRTFRNEVAGGRPVDDMAREISLIRACEAEAEAMTEKELEENRLKVCELVEKAAQSVREKNRTTVCEGV